MQTWSCHTEQVDGCQGRPPCQLVLCSKRHRLKSSNEEGTERPGTRWVSITHLEGGTPSSRDVRYDFEEKDDLGKDQYTFQLEIPM